MYWLPNAAASSGRIYWEGFVGATGELPQIHIRAGVSVFPNEIARVSRRWADERSTQLVHYNALERGGHFAAFEQPELFVAGVRDCFRHIGT